MKALRKTFWITFGLTIISFVGIILLFRFSPEDRVFFEILIVIVPSLSMGLLVSVIMTFVSHRNEKDQYMKKLYNKARTTFYFFQEYTAAIDDVLDTISNPDVAINCAMYCRNLANNALTRHYDNPLSFRGIFAYIFNKR